MKVQKGDAVEMRIFILLISWEKQNKTKKKILPFTHILHLSPIFTSWGEKRQWNVVRKATIQLLGKWWSTCLRSPNSGRKSGNLNLRWSVSDLKKKKKPPSAASPLTPDSATLLDNSVDSFGQQKIRDEEVSRDEGWKNKYYMACLNLRENNCFWRRQSW